MSDDVVSRVKAAWEESAADGCTRNGYLASLVPELVSEVEKLRAELNPPLRPPAEVWAETKCGWCGRPIQLCAETNCITRKYHGKPSGVLFEGREPSE